MRNIWVRALIPLAFTAGLGWMSADAADNTDPSTQYSNVLCMMDAKDAFDNPSLPGERAADSSNLHCTGSLANENIKLTCQVLYEGWQSGDMTTKDFPCVIQGGQCGVAAPSGDPNAPGLTATASQFQISADGSAQMQCSWDASKSPYIP